MKRGNIGSSSSSEDSDDDEKPFYGELAQSVQFFVCTKQKAQLSELKTQT
jgi:hypothetical protein